MKVGAAILQGSSYRLRKICAYEFFAAASFNNAVRDEVCFIAERLGAAHVVRDSDHRVARLLVELVEYLHHLAEPVIVLPYRRFVQKQDFGLTGDHGRYRYPAFLPFGERLRVAMPEVFNTEKRGDMLGIFGRGRAETYLFFHRRHKELVVGILIDDAHLFEPSAAAARLLFELFGIKHLWHRHPQSLSEGQKRRVSIAAVVACQPEALLLDEPTVGQDYDGLCQMVEILNKLHEQTGNTMITITHDVRCAEALCDHAYLIAGGVVERSGEKELVREYFTS